MSTTFFTCCDIKYQDFVPFFISSVLKSNSDSVVEVGVEDIKYSNNFQLSIKYLKDLYGDKFLLREVKFGDRDINEKSFKVCPNVVRFIEEPILKNDYVYISDVDIIILDNNITDIHLNNMRRTGLNYSNILRPNKKKLTGLHFSKWDNYYPIGNIDDLASILNFDEVFLYYFVGRKNNIIEKIQGKADTFRPVHGIHISPNRTVYPSLDSFGFVKPGWGIDENDNFHKWKLYRETEEFKVLESLTSYFMKENFVKIDSFK
jgi:hypothetical protein